MNIFQNNFNEYDSCFSIQASDDKYSQLFTPEEAFMLGNLFKNLYMSYQGFSNCCLQPLNQRQRLLLNVQIYQFVAHEINLYLDMHPNNQNMIELYREYVKKAQKATEEFEKNYGPLVVSDASSKCLFEWLQGPWPWEYQL